MAREPKEREGPIGVRLPPAVKASLEAAAEANHRSLHGEIVARLAASATPTVERREALGELVTMVDNRLAWMTGQIEREGRTQPNFLALLREGLNGLFDELGAKDAKLGEDERAMARGIGQWRSRELLSAEVPTGAYAELAPEETQDKTRLVAIRRALGLTRKEVAP